MEKQPKWKDLHLHQKVKYIAEIAAIAGGLILLSLTFRQVRLLTEQNSIALTTLKATFPLSVELKMLNYKDSSPIVIRMNIKNLGRDKVRVGDIVVPTIIQEGSFKVESAITTVKTNLYKKEKPKDDSQVGRQEIILGEGESGTLEVSADLKIEPHYQKDDLFKDKPVYTSFIILPVHLSGIDTSDGRNARKTILISMSRSKDKSLKVYSELMDVTDNENLIYIARIKRAMLSMPEWK
ncbi:MAG: hypothetical protein ACYC69_02730 [Thermodesulfovibrionales bacterium]